MRREPITKGQIVAAIMSALSLLVAFDVISLNEGQLEQTEESVAQVLAVAFPIIAAFWSRLQTTPWRDARDDKGRKLVPEN